MFESGKIIGNRLGKYSQYDKLDFDQNHGDIQSGKIIGNSL